MSLAAVPHCCPWAPPDLGMGCGFALSTASHLFLMPLVSLYAILKVTPPERPSLPILPKIYLAFFSLEVPHSSKHSPECEYIWIFSISALDYVSVWHVLQRLEWNGSLIHCSIGKWWNLQEVGPRGKKLSHWQLSLEGNIGTPVSPYISVCPSHHEVSSYVSPCTLVFCPETTARTNSPFL